MGYENTYIHLVVVLEKKIFKNWVLIFSKKNDWVHKNMTIYIRDV